MKNYLKVSITCVAVFLAILIGFSSPAISAPKGKPIIIGVPVGSDFHGKDTTDSIRLAVKEINKAGGIKVGGVMRPLKYVVEDTRDMEPGVPITDSLLAIERLLTQRKADFLVGGPVRSEASFAARPLVAGYKKIWIITVGTYSPGFCDPSKFPYTFRIVGNAIFQIPYVWAKLPIIAGEKFGFKKVFYMGEDNKISRISGDLIGKVVTKAGMEMVGQTFYPTGGTDFSVGLLEAKEKGAQIISLIITMPETNILVKQWHDMKIPAMLIGYVGPAFHLDFWKATEGKCEYVVSDIVNAGNVPSEATPMTMKFVNAFKKEYGHEPDGYGHSSSYQGIYLLKDAIERAGTLDSDAVAKALEKTDMIGVYGRMRFDKNHEIIFDPNYDPKEGAITSSFQWQKGKRVTVFPETIKKGEILLPPWMKSNR
ncbi:MAG: ABC transporter substrate-binding protein [Pseudomonadota bacterium]